MSTRFHILIVYCFTIYNGISAFEFLHTVLFLFNTNHRKSLKTAQGCFAAHFLLLLGYFLRAVLWTHAETEFKNKKKQ